jgi:hypothetical protein
LFLSKFTTSPPLEPLPAVHPQHRNFMSSQNIQTIFDNFARHNFRPNRRSVNATLRINLNAKFADVNLKRINRFRVQRHAIYFPAKVNRGNGQDGFIVSIDSDGLHIFS